MADRAGQTRLAGLDSYVGSFAACWGDYYIVSAGWMGEMTYADGSTAMRPRSMFLLVDAARSLGRPGNPLERWSTDLVGQH